MISAKFPAPAFLRLEGNSGSGVGAEKGNEVVQKEDGEEGADQDFAKAEGEPVPETQEARGEEADPEGTGKPETEEGQQGDIAV